ncbi:transcriptional regulator, TetR family [Nocardioides alpinus]|uniref:Transcriptional regulator, TetR family n=1 Tax=Nocardioides alpinus TaxID=748909 RepID=A0A1I0VBY6_9ACTN|nr:TetR/AcrR family transcriptional regulator C-terminal domain-containing protein [Nocardioides alpinus]SFA73772.1 transcriptional regulator, TetR family [Nocardioides alpinus]
MAGRGRPRTLSRDGVLSAAVLRADRTGLDGLTMRALADDLGVEAMSLYHHLPGKAGLLDGLVEHLMTEVDTATAGIGTGEDWRDGVRDRCLAARDVMERHRWGPGLLMSRTAIPPSVFAHFEAVLAAMVGAGFTHHLGHRALHSLGSMVLGFTQELFAPASDSDGAQSEEELAAMAELLPHVTAMVAAELHAADGDVLGWCDSRAEFEFTLDLLLDGLEAHRLRGRSAS